MVCSKHLDMTFELLRGILCTDVGLVSVFDDCQVSFFDKADFKTDTVAVRHIQQRGSLYHLPKRRVTHLSLASTHVSQSLLDWHVTSNHIGLKTLKLTLKYLKSPNIKFNLMKEMRSKYNNVQLAYKARCLGSRLLLVPLIVLLNVVRSSTRCM